MALFGWLHNKKIGESGEEIARKYIRKLGLKILDTNWRSKRLELDIVAISKRKKILHIIEVKSRTSDSWQAVGESFTDKKIAALRSGAIAYKYYNGRVADYSIVFDVVVVFFDESKGDTIEYIPDIRF